MANASKPDDVSQVTNAVWNMTWLNLLGLLVVIMFTVFSTQSTDASERFRAAAVGLLAAVATCLVGAVLGFVFGIPRALQEDREAPLTSPRSTTSTNIAMPVKETEPDVQLREKATYRANTNLERISDWLTTVIVGVGLTQLNVLPGNVKTLAEFVSSGLGGTPTATVAAAAIIVYYGIGGFLLGYLWTRLYFSRALSVAEQH